jgi:hypothetical protein
MQLSKKTKATAIATVAIAVVLAIATAGFLNQPTINNSGTDTVGGTIETTLNIDVYSDVNATVPCSSLTWGDLKPGITATRIVYIKNTGDTDLTLNMSTSNWTPSAASHALTLSWDRESYSLSPDSMVTATLRLTASRNMGVLSDFSFEITFSGSA